MHTLEGLRSLSIDGPRLGVVGCPIKHSLSPLFQNAALKALSERNTDFSDWEYLKIEAPVHQLKDVIDVAIEKQFRGLNLTLPHKVEVTQYLDDIDAVAEKMGAVNTLDFREGRVVGYNSDGFGMENAILDGLGISLKSRTVLLIGAGGASRAACVQCLEAGCKRLVVANRSSGRLSELIEQLKQSYPERDIRSFLLGDPSMEILLDDGALLINATALGLKADDPLPVSEAVIQRSSYLFDMVYGVHETPLVLKAQELKVPAVNGLGMLIFQGARSLEIWTGEPAPTDIMKAAVIKHLRGK